MSREQKLEQAIEKLLACPAIADGNHSEPAWGCKETAEAEAFARAALSTPKAEAVEQIPQNDWDEAYRSGFNDGFGEAKLSSKANASLLINEATTLIREDREDLFASHQVDGKFRIECDADRRAESHIADMDRWLEQAEQFLNGASITTSAVPALTDEAVERAMEVYHCGMIKEQSDRTASGVVFRYKPKSAMRAALLATLLSKGGE